MNPFGLPSTGPPSGFPSAAPGGFGAPAPAGLPAGGWGGFGGTAPSFGGAGRYGQPIRTEEENDAQRLSRTAGADRGWLDAIVPLKLLDEDYAVVRGQTAEKELDAVEPTIEASVSPWKPPGEPISLRPLSDEDQDLTENLLEALVSNATRACGLRTVFGAVFSNRVSIVRRLMLARERESLRNAQAVRVYLGSIIVFTHS